MLALSAPMKSTKRFACDSLVHDVTVSVKMAALIAEFLTIFNRRFLTKKTENLLADSLFL